MDPGTTGSSSASGTGEASSCMIWPWNGTSSVNGTQLTPLCSLSAPSAATWSRGADGVDEPLRVPDADGEDHLRLVVEVAPERVGTDAGGPEQLRRAQRIGGHHDGAGAHAVRLARAQVADLDAGGAAVLDEHAGHERLVEEVELGVRAGDVAEHDVGARPHQAAVVPPMHRERHPLHACCRVTALVHGRREALAHDGTERGRVERVGRDPEQAVGLVEQVVEVGRGRRCARCRPAAGQAAVQCADMPPTLLDIAATGSPSSPGKA